MIINFPLPTKTSSKVMSKTRETPFTLSTETSRNYLRTCLSSVLKIEAEETIILQLQVILPQAKLIVSSGVVQELINHLLAVKCKEADLQSPELYHAKLMPTSRLKSTETGTFETIFNRKKQRT